MAAAEVARVRGLSQQGALAVISQQRVRLALKARAGSSELRCLFCGAPGDYCAAVDRPAPNRIVVYPICLGCAEKCEDHEELDAYAIRVAEGQEGASA